MPAPSATTYTQMQEQLQYVLCNLDVENMSEPLRARLNSIQ